MIMVVDRNRADSVLEKLGEGLIIGEVIRVNESIRVKVD